MAGYTPLLIESDGRNHSVPDHFQDIVISVGGLQVEGNPGTNDDIVLFYAERDTVIDSAFVIPTSSDADQTFTLKRITSGQDPNSAGTAITNTILAATLYQPETFTVVATENLIPAGSMVGLNIVNNRTDGHITIQMRIRTRVTG